MTRGLRLCIGAALFLALAACEDEAERSAPVETGGEAEGEVLGGTISDEMLPLEALTSTSPLAQGEENGEADEDSEASDTASEE